MKTNQEMIRYIGQYSVIQRTSDGFFDANSYLHSINGNSDCDSDIDEYVEHVANAFSIGIAIMLDIIPASPIMNHPK